MKNNRKWIWLAVVILLLALFGIYRYYIYTQQDEWNKEDAAIIRAKKETQLVSVTKTQKSVWDDVYYIIYGKNAAGQNMIVWVSSTQVHAELQQNGVSAKDIKAKVYNELPGIRIVHLIPSVFEQQYVWEVFYKDDDHYNYRFYRFSDGQQVGETYTLPNS
ncbi:DUF5590 domain-containing protein [Paenibacillus sediminis]|uniref:Uncharacterized protein YpmB n=1 Tax=Paenibacillus sediminis TaxID=664909 RepID=A0ABS4GZV6_9BACL|nr:DUF5590 domain-containing protein [Paenibacillus sediminis]MBP1935806.1 uncharacterized protein YpmB [Paenibacillus sediminis]